MPFDTLKETPVENKKKRIGQREIISSRVTSRLIAKQAIGTDQISSEVISTTSTSTLTNKTINADNNTITNLRHGGEVDNPTNSVHGATGYIVGTTDNQALTNKTIVAGSNTISGLSGNEVDHGTVGTDLDLIPFIISKDVSNAATTVIMNANAPYKFRIIEAWVVSTVAGNSGNWNIDNGTNNITTAIAYSATDNAIVRAASIDNAYYEIAINGTLRCINSVNTDDAILYIMAIRVD